jgi:hypothetical protein
VYLVVDGLAPLHTALGAGLLVIVFVRVLVGARAAVRTQPEGSARYGGTYGESTAGRPRPRGMRVGRASRVRGMRGD